MFIIYRFSLSLTFKEHQTKTRFAADLSAMGRCSSFASGLVWPSLTNWTCFRTKFSKMVFRRTPQCLYTYYIQTHIFPRYHLLSIKHYEIPIDQLNRTFRSSPFFALSVSSAKSRNNSIMTLNDTFG